MSKFASQSHSVDDGGQTKAEDPFGKCRQHQGNLVRGGFQPIPWWVTSGGKRRVAGETSKGLDAFSLAMLASS